MSEPASIEAATAHPFRCYIVDDTGAKKTYVGGSYDNISAVTIACAVYDAIQDYSISTWRKIVIYDSTDTAIAFIGAEQETPPQEVPAAPVLTSLVPDSSGNWDALITVHGTGFTPTSQILADSNPVTTQTYVSATEMNGVAPISAAGVYLISVRNGTQESNSLSFNAL